MCCPIHRRGSPDEVDMCKSAYSSGYDVRRTEE
jgi:hypothetical protein